MRIQMRKNTLKEIEDMGFYLNSDLSEKLDMNVFECGEGYFYEIKNSRNIKAGKVPAKFHVSNPFTIQNIKTFISKNDLKLELVSEIYQGSDAKLEVKCLIHDYIWNPSWDSLKQKKGCPKCSGLIVSNENSIESLRPDLIPYLKNPEDAKLYSIKSDKKIKIICPLCGKEDEIQVSRFTTRLNNFCKKCSNKESTPNRFLSNILDFLNISFEQEKKFLWSDKKKYDFFIPNLNMIIEVNGKQHYCETNRGRSLQEEMENDTFKYNIAIKNGISKYIVIDASSSEKDFLITSFVKELKKDFILEKVDFDKVWLNTLHTSEIEEIAKLYNEHYSVKEIRDKLKLHHTTVNEKLLIAQEIGLVNYVPINKIGKRIYQYDLNLNLIKEYSSVAEASRENKLSSGNISDCALNKRYRKTVGGFIWKYEKIERND